MKNIEHKNDDGKRYLKKYEIVETDVELPIQDQIRDPEDPYKFLKDLEDEAISKTCSSGIRSFWVPPRDFEKLIQKAKKRKGYYLKTL